MHIIMIGPRRLFPHPRAGIDFYVKELSQYLAGLGHAITIYCHQKSERTATLPAGIKIKYLWSFKNHHLDTFSYGFLASLLSLFQKESVLHYHGGAALFSWIPRLARKKIVVTIHSREWLYVHTRFFLRPLYRLAEWMGVQMADRVACVSQNLQQDLQKSYAKEILCIPLGLKPQHGARTSLLARHRLIPKQYLLFLGRIEKGKGIEFLLEAYQTLNPQNRPPLVIAGEPLYDLAYFQKLKNQAGSPKHDVTFLGRVDGEEKNEILANALIYLQASQSEGLSIALLEAMSFGLPVFVGNIAQNMEAIGSAGFYFRNGDAKDFQFQLEKLLADPQLLKQKGEEARQKIETEFSWEKRAPTIEKLYSFTPCTSPSYTFKIS